MVSRAILFLLVLAALSGFSLNAQQSEAARQLFKQTKAKADKGDAHSQLAVADFYASGTGVELDPRKAVKYYRKAAEQNLAQAQLQLGLQYARGTGIEKDANEAAFWFTKAADQGLLEAQLEIGNCLFTGKGVNANGIEALKWFRKAAAQGSAVAEYRIGKCYLEGTGVSRDIEEGVNWIRRSANAGFPLAQNALGSCYEKGSGVEQDYLQAYKWYALAAAQDDVNAPDIRVSIAKAELHLTREQVAQAQRLAREFKPGAPDKSSDPAEARQEHSDSGFVNVSSADLDSEIFLDGSFVGNTPAKLKIKPGTHVIEVKKAGFKDYRREINVSAGSELSLRATQEKQ